MKHWHRCRRWEKRGIVCPFSSISGHEDPDRPDGPDDELRFTDTERFPAEAPIGVAPEPVPEVGVREPRVTAPPPQEAAAEAKPSRRIGQNISGKTLESFEIPFGQPAAGRVAVEEPAGTAIARMEGARRHGQNIAGQTRETFEKRARETAGVRKGTKAPISEMAEIAAAEATRRDTAGALGTVLALAAASTVPLVRAGVSQLRSSMRIRPGVLGPAGRMDPVRPASTFRTGEGPTPRQVRPGVGQRLRRGGRTPATSRGSGGMHVDARNLLQGMIRVRVRRSQNISGRQSRGGL